MGGQLAVSSPGREIHEKNSLVKKSFKYQWTYCTEWTQFIDTPNIVRKNYVINN